MFSSFCFLLQSLLTENRAGSGAGASTCKKRIPPLRPTRLLKTACHRQQRFKHLMIKVLDIPFAEFESLGFEVCFKRFHSRIFNRYEALEHSKLKTRRQRALPLK